YAIEKRIHLIEMGATTYATKLLFGGHLERRWLYFRCRWSIATAVVRPFLWLCDFGRNDPELRMLKTAVREQEGTELSFALRPGAGASEYRRSRYPSW